MKERTSRVFDDDGKVAVTRFFSALRDVILTSSATVNQFRELTSPTVLNFDDDVSHFKQKTMRQFFGYDVYFLIIVAFVQTVTFSCVAAFSLLAPHSLAFSARFSAHTMSLASSSTSSPGLVAVVGSANQDLTTYTTRFPVKGETVLGKSFEHSCGGKGANQAVAAASLGIAPVSMICRVGKDTFGDAILSNFRKSSKSKQD